MKKIILSLAFIGSILSLSSCVSTKPEENPPHENQGNEENIEFEFQVTKSELEVDEETSFSYSSKQDFVKSKVSFKYNEEIISLNLSTNTIKALKIGNTELEILYDNKTKGKVTIVISEKSIFPKLIKTNFGRKVIGVNEELQLDVTFEPLDTNRKKLTYRSSDHSVISVSKTGLIKGIAVGEGTIIVSSSEAEINSIVINLKVSNNETEVNNDLLASIKDVASANEINDIQSGEISIKTKNKNSNEKHFTNSYSIFDNHIYNKICDFDGFEYVNFNGIKDETLFTLTKEGEKTTYRKSSKIINNDEMPFGNQVKKDDAYSMTYLPSILVDKYSKEYTQGIKGLVNHILSFYFSAQYQESIIVSFEDSILKMTSFISSYLGDTKNNLEIVFDENNYKNLVFSSKTYEIGALDNEGNVKENALVNEYYEVSASLNKGERKPEVNPEIDMNKLFFEDFELSFFESTDLTTPKTKFSKGATIVYRVERSKPIEADQFIDLIEIESVSDPTVLGVAPNKTALNALKEGVCDVTFKSKNVKKTYTIEIFEVAAEGFKFSSGLKDVMSNNETVSFFVDSIPFGSKNDSIVTLSEGAEKYVTLSSEEKNGTLFYYLKGNPTMEEKEATINVIASSKSNREIKVIKTIKVVKALTDKEIFDILISSKFVSETNPDYYNKTIDIAFNEDRSGLINVYNNNGNIFDSCNFTYTINKGKVTIIGGDNFSKGYLTDLRVDLKVADLSSINISFVDALGGDDDGISFVFVAIKENLNEK